jgi:hypothetical protein
LLDLLRAELVRLGRDSAARVMAENRHQRAPERLSACGRR